MIYIESTTNRQTIIAPTPYGYAEGGEPVRIALLSTVDLWEFSAQIATLGGSFNASSFSSAFRIGEAGAVRQTADGMYLIFDVSFAPAPAVGSWEYRLLQGNRLLGGGCAQVGDYIAEREEYDKPIVYEQYQ